ncbi:MAG: sigma-70 family RNA polymerase sigma factor [Candidatus Zixiibacteriota bacterium]
MNTVPGHDPDSADVQRVLDGDINAYEGIVKRWQGPIINLAYRFCREQGLAEEIAQDVFLKAFKSLKGWRGESRFSSWLFALALNMCRSRMRRLRPVLRPIEEAERIAGTGQPDADYETAEESEIVRRLVLQLPRKYREAIVVFYFHDQSVPEAAATLKIPEGTLKARLHRGRELLRKKIGARPGLTLSLGVA